MEQKSKWQKLDRETTVFILFLIGMAVYYGWRMFALTPWYDELYTYYYFISRGPVYAAIHWPVPNNHMGYSVLSACMGIFGNSTIALRGISYLCSIGGLVLLFRIGRKCLDRGMALIPVFLYAGMKLTNQLAVQGRGYALVSFCYLTAVCALLHITVEGRNRVRDYAIFGICLVVALYTIPSSVYVVVPVCLTGGIMLLLNKQYRTLVRLIITSIASAVCTVGVYSIVWLAIGSNLLMKTEGSGYFGMGHVAIILHAPIQALLTGAHYMLATPYIQSVDREEFASRFAGWLSGLLNEYYAGGAVILAFLLSVCVAAVIMSMMRRMKTGKDRLASEAEQAKELSADDQFMEIYLAVGIISIPLMLVIQCSLPYYRVFSYAGITVALAAAWVCQKIRRHLAERYSAAMILAGSVITAILCVVMLCTSSYRAQYSDREAAIEDAYRQIDVAQVDKIAVTDCDQEYLLLFLYNIGEERITRQLEEAEIVLADKFLLLHYNTDVIDWSGDDWKLYFTPEQFEEAGVTQSMEAVYENDRFVLYSKKE
ncbi:MAG: glycosyltransferase family 39 protein [Lachnospiraceae bacterium]|nr:glycosyltransferase family 39 protein [Lachnospiraceae bacterium]